MKVSYALKTLKTKKTFQSFIPKERQLLLLKIKKNDHCGYATYSPWQSLGQPTIKEVLKNTNRSNIYFLAQEDLKSVQDSSKLFHYCIKNHSFLFANQTIQIDKDIIKIKLSGERKRDLRTINDQVKTFKTLRLDCNTKYEKKDFLKLIKNLAPLKEKIQYIEDPIIYRESDYKELEELGIPIAYDQVFNNALIKKRPQNVVLKPMLRQNHHKNNVYSNNMGHPFELWQTYHQLITYGDLNLTHGLYMPSLYEELPNTMEIDNNRVIPNKDVIDFYYSSFRKVVWKEI
ncbi:MAG: hypothetical protein ACPGJV_02460 [Bacteriovoracaceae bacterium]